MGDREWGVENRPHYVRGVTMGEDACRAREGSAPQVLAGVRNAGVRNAGVALLRGDGWEDIAAALRHHAVNVAKGLSLVGIQGNEKTLGGQCRQCSTHGGDES